MYLKKNKETSLHFKAPQRILIKVIN